MHRIVPCVSAVCMERSPRSDAPGQDLVDLGARTVAVSSPLAGLVAPIPVRTIVVRAPAGEVDATSCVEAVWPAQR